MKIIEALKTIKANKAKVEDLIQKIKMNSAIRSDQTSPYGNKAFEQVNTWLDMVRQVLRDNEILTRCIHKTNNDTLVTIEIGGVAVAKSIDEWLTRRNGNIQLQQMAYGSLTDRGLKEELVKMPDGSVQHVTIVRHFDAAVRDTVLEHLAQETSLIDMRIEIVNATTDLME
jgi:hypothetical protein